VANELNPDVLRRFAKLGAQARLEQIEMERRAILATFPDLALQRRGAARAVAASPQVAAPVAARRRRPRMTAAQRKEVSERMKKYWAERKKKGGK
jgi:hypothetical protein